MNISLKCTLLVALISLSNIPTSMAQGNSYALLNSCNYKNKNAEDIDDLKKAVRLKTWAIARRVDEKSKHHVLIKDVYYQYLGTATLIDKGGFLITAAHVISGYTSSELKQKGLYLIQYLPDGKEYVVKEISKVISVGESGDTLESAGKDLAILYSPDFDEDIDPVPLRATSNSSGSGIFVALTPHLHGAESYEIAPHDVYYYGLDSQNIRYLELKGHPPARLMSGALVIDMAGLGFGIAAVRFNPDLIETKLDDEDAADKKNFAEYKFGIAILEIDGKWLDDLLREVKSKSEFSKTLVRISGRKAAWEYFSNKYKGPLTLLQLREINENCRNADSFFKNWTSDLKKRYVDYFIYQSEYLCISRDYNFNSDCQKMVSEVKPRKLVATRLDDKISPIGTEVMMRKGLDKLDEQNPTQKESPYRANAYVDLSNPIVS